MRKFVALLLAGLTLLQAPASAQLPTLGDSSDMNVSAERKLGETGAFRMLIHVFHH